MEYNIIYYTRIIINIIIIITIIVIVILFYVLSPLLVVFEHEFEFFFCLQTLDENDYNTFKHIFIFLSFHNL